MTPIERAVAGLTLNVPDMVPRSIILQGCFLI
jgi:hypothetical protein